MKVAVWAINVNALLKFASSPMHFTIKHFVSALLPYLLMFTSLLWI